MSGHLSVSGSEADDNSFQSSSPHTSENSSTETVTAPRQRRPQTQVSTKDYESLDYDRCYNKPYERLVDRLGQGHSAAKLEAIKWIVTFLIGFLTGMVALFIDVVVKHLSSLKFGTVDSSIMQCGKDGCLAVSLVLLLLFNVGFTIIASALVVYEPVAGGSGIPEIKCYLNGVKVPNVARLHTLVAKAIGVLFSVAGDATPAEVYKEGGAALTERLHQLFLLMEDPCQDPAQPPHSTQGLLPESQCGFRKERGTIDMVFAARQLQEKCQEQNSDLFSTYVDLTKAFDTVSREGLWNIMAKYGCPRKFIALVQQFHEGMQARVQDSGETSDPFPVTNGVKQGCVLAPTLFSLMFSAMLTDAFRDGDIGIALMYRTDGKLFNLRRLQAKTKVTKDIIRDFLFADDCALNAVSEADMQCSVDMFSSACSNFGLTISTKKIEVLHQPAPGKPYVEPDITVNGQRLNTVNRFTYLGSTLSQNVTIDDEVNVRIARASSTFGRLYPNVWNRRGISTQTKLKVYRAVVLPTLLYACETWTVYQRHARKLNHFHTTSLRKILGIKWQDKVPDTEVLARADLPSITTILMQSQLRWAGHVARMPDERLPKRLFYGELQQGQRSHGGQKKRFKDTLKASLKAFSINPDTWEKSALDRATWRSSIHKGAKMCEASRTTAAELMRQTRKARAINPPGDVPLVPCPFCVRTFRARIGLVSHLRTHRNSQPQQPPDD
ncbi:uncharacterized protein [Littorina saxatilis]|uniref:uncharacterized protein n=1 Tax=Littorina saxatilis TaxID=31220 RepID=UPI0038B5AE3A